MVDFIKELLIENNTISYGITVDIPKLAEWAKQKTGKYKNCVKWWSV